MSEVARDPCRVPRCPNDAEKEISLCRPGRETEILLCGEHASVDEFDRLVESDHSAVYSVVYGVYDPNPPCPDCSDELSSLLVDGDLYGYVCPDCRIQWLGVSDLEIRRVHPTTDAEPNVAADGGASHWRNAAPDDRAMHIRRVLRQKVERADPGPDADESTVSLSRNDCSGILSTILARGSIVDAMKRAADGRDASDSTAVDYAPIQGTSDLDPVDAITYRSGRAVGDSNGPAQSSIEVTIADDTGPDIPVVVRGGAVADD